MKALCILLLCVSLLLTGCGSSAATKSVVSELNLIRQLDEETIRLFVSYEDMMRSGTQTSTVGEETTEAIRLFFRNFSYRILSEETDGDTAQVCVRITNLDMQSVAHDLCIALTERQADPRETPEALTTDGYFAILGETLKTHSYRLLSTDAVLQTAKDADGSWSIRGSDELEDQLVSGFISYLNDPYLVMPDEVLSLTLDCFLTFSAEDWQEYLGMDDIFSTGSTLSSQSDGALAERIRKDFSYRISDTSVNGDEAVVTVSVTSLDLTAVMEDYKEKLLDFASTTDSVRATDAELADRTAQMLCDSLTSVSGTVTTDVAISFSNNGTSWEMELSDAFTQALLGNPAEALEALS